VFPAGGNRQAETKELESLGQLQDVFDPAQRYDHPTGPMVQLIPDLIDGFVEKIGFE
jgi:hypothetical protein